MSAPDLPMLVQGLGPQITHLTVTARSVPEADEASLITGLMAEDAEGWVCFTDAVKTLAQLRRDGAPRAPARLLSAERWLKGESQHIRPEEDGWRVVTTCESAEDAPGATLVLAFDEELIGDRSRNHKVRIYWRPDPGEPGQPWRPWLAAFRGFAPTEGAA